MTLLFTDIERSTHLLQQLGSRYVSLLTACRDLLRTALRQWHGCEVDIQGDSFFAVFARATDAVSAAVAAQRSLSTHSWPEDVAVRVRMGLHTGSPDRSSEGYTGLDVHYAARIMSAAHGGQVLLSQTTRDLVAHDLPEDVTLRDVGAYHLKDFRGPKHLFQLVLDAPARQQTLRNTLAWSYHLLDAPEQQFFRRLSVFVGGFTLQAAEAMCSAFADRRGSVLDRIGSLIDKSLLHQIEQEGDEPRLLMLETIREYGLECLASSGELEATRQAHAAYYLHLAEEADTHPYEKWWFERLAWEHHNLRAALHWSTEHMEGMEEKEAGPRKEIALRLVGALARFWWSRGFFREGQTWLQRVLLDTESSEAIQPLIRAEVLDRAGWLFVMVNDGERAEVLFQESLRLYREAGEMARTAWPLLWLGWCALKRGNNSQSRSLLQQSRALAGGGGEAAGLNKGAVPLYLGVLASGLGEYADARSLLEEALAFYREKHIQEAIAWSLRYLGHVLFAQDDTGRASALFEESLALSRELGNWRGLAYSLYWLGRCAIARGEGSRAREQFEESLDVYKTRVMSPQSNTALILAHLARVTAQQGDFMAAETFYQESLALFRQTDERAGMAFCLQGWGALAARQGKLIWAARLWGAAQTLGSSDYIPGPILLPVEQTVAERREIDRCSNSQTEYMVCRFLEITMVEGWALERTPQRPHPDKEQKRCVLSNRSPWSLVPPRVLVARWSSASRRREPL